jgi:hypothetical protein
MFWQSPRLRRAFVEEVGKLGQLGADWSAPLCRCGFGVILSKRGGDEGGDNEPSALVGMRQRIAHEVLAPGHGSLDALVGVADDQLGAARPLRVSLRRIAVQNRCAFGGTAIHTENFTRRSIRDRFG